MAAFFVVGGMAVPVLLYSAVKVVGDGQTRGWAIFTATDSAFALGALALVGSRLPLALRSFLLTLTVIAGFYTEELSWLPLVFAVVPVMLFWLVVRRRRTTWWLVWPLGPSAWALVHASGVRATVAGVVPRLIVSVVSVNRPGVHPSRARPWPALGRPVRRLLAHRDRVHGFPAHRGAALRVRFGSRRARADLCADRVLGRGGPGSQHPRLPASGSSGWVRGVRGTGRRRCAEHR